MHGGDAFEAQRDGLRMQRLEVREPGGERCGAVQGAGAGWPVRMREQPRELVLQLPAVDDHVERALCHQEFGALEAVRQFFADGLLDHARARETDQRAGLGEHQVRHEREGGRDAAHRRIGEDRHERQPRAGQLLQHRGRLRHLEQRVDALLHARAARGRNAHERDPVLVGNAHAANETLPDDRAHRAAHELELEAREHQRHALHAALEHDERVGLARLVERGNEPVRILLLVLELEAVDGHDLRADLEAAFRVEQLLDALARRHPDVEIALRTDEEVLLEVGAIEHRFAGRALDPEPLRHGRLLAAGRAADPRRQQLLQPAHLRPPSLTPPASAPNRAPCGCRRARPRRAPRRPRVPRTRSPGSAGCR